MEKFILNGKKINLPEIIQNFPTSNGYTDFEYKVLVILREWLSGKKSFYFHTSGTTGDPKEISFSREQIRKSALRTIRTFNIKPGMTVLACLNPEFIAGFMMIIRAMEGDLNLLAVEPCSNPLTQLEPMSDIDYAAMTPMQVKTCLSETPDRLNRIKTLLIGGAGLHPDLEEKLHDLPVRIFHSYAMTETVTHVALREIVKIGKNDWFEALEGVRFEADEDGCLVVRDELLKIMVKTNDLAELIDERHFVLKGRMDHVVNSGGVKIQLERLEDEISVRLREYGIHATICLAGIPDELLTNKLALIIEIPEASLDTKDLLRALRKILPKYHDPKVIIPVPELFFTKSGKIDRRRNIQVYIYGNDESSK